MFLIMSKYSLIFFIGICSLAQSSKAQDLKIWRRDTNFDNPVNWENGQLPCGNDRIIFPASMPVATFMPESFSAAEIVLPMNGELIFPGNAEFKLTGGKQEGSCLGRDVHFKPPLYNWFDPSNWNITSDRAFPRIPSRRNSAVPHSFQVPCWKDKVEFPASTTFRVHMDYPSTSIAALRINDIDYTEQNFEDLLKTHIGSLLFPDTPKIQITSRDCTDDSGCACGNDGPEVLPTICRYAFQCPELECSDPIEIVGHCCSICGASLLIQYDTRFKMKKIIKLHQRFLAEAKYQEVESFIGKTHEDAIQSVFVDGGGNKGLANKVAELIHQEIINDIDGVYSYRIRSSRIRKSEAWNAGVPTFDKHTSGMSSGGVAALIILMLVIFGLGIFFYVYKKRQIPGFSFARFDLRSDKIELELGTTPHEELEPGDTPATSSAEEKSKAFDNPVYGTGVNSEVATGEEEPSEVRNFVENPMFMIFEDSSERSDSEKS